MDYGERGAVVFQRNRISEVEVVGKQRMQRLDGYNVDVFLARRDGHLGIAAVDCEKVVRFQEAHGIDPRMNPNYKKFNNDIYFCALGKLVSDLDDSILKDGQRTL